MRSEQPQPYGVSRPGATHNRETARYRGRMGRLGVTCISLVVLALVPVAGTASTTSGLRGKVTVSPSRPVCIEGQPCSKPAPGVLIAFKRCSRVVARVTTRADATYRVILPPGTYTVVAPQYRRGSGVTPHTVRVPKSRIARVDLEIDTGIQ